MLWLGLVYWVPERCERIARAMMGIPPRRQSGPQSLFVRAREDPTTYGDVYLAYRKQVLRFFVRRVLDPEHAFDLMAETFATVFAQLQSFRGETEDQGRAWMWTIARTQLAQWRRAGEVERRNLERLALPVPSLGAAEYERVEELADLERFKPILDRALAELPETQRFVLHEHFVNGRGYDDIARQDGSSAVALRLRSSRALRQLSRVLDRLDALDDDEAQELVT
jgi:RNA polymerase sigma-70 factor (ECF subfamily)